jgi:hypothetical protein
VELGRELAKAGFRILVYFSAPTMLEAPVVKGYVASENARPGSIQVRYPLHGQKPAFPEQLTHGQLFDWRPDSGPDWEMSFYQSLKEVDGILLVGGAQSTLIGGLVAMGHRTAVVALASFGGSAAKIWESLRPGRDLPTADEISLMARPQWSSERAADCAKAFQEQLARRAAEVRQRLLDELRREASIRRHAAWALALFVAAVVCVPVAWGQQLSLTAAIWLLFVSPLLAGVAGSTIRLVFDLRQGSVPLSRESALTTAALGVVAGGVAGLLFITAQVTTVGTSVTSEQASRLVPFGVVIGFIAGLTLDAVFRKLIASDVVELSAVEAKKRA